MKKIGILINPNAKKFRTKKSSLKNYTNIQSDNLLIKLTENIDDIQNIIKEFKNNSCDYIGIAGGDGTLHLAVTEIIHTYGEEHTPPVLILREGTMNNVARTIKLQGKGPDLIKRLLWSINNKKEIEIHQRNTMKINDKYCFLFGTGLVTNFLNEVYSGKEKGFIRNIQVALSAFYEGLKNADDGKIFNWMHGEIRIDKNTIEINPVNGILAGTVEHIGMGFSPLSMASKEKDRFQIIITAMGPGKLLKNINRLRTGNMINDKGYYNALCKTIKLTYPGEFDYTMDGDIYKADKELLVETGPLIKLIKI
ncbi:MAG: diacylglycerol kinase family protein [Spirochaetota bacterium]